MVAITVVLAAVVFVMVSGMLVKPPPPPAAVTLESRDWTGANYTASVTSATAVSDMPADELTFVLQDDGGAPYFTGKAGETNTVNSVSVTVRFLDIESNNRISTGDSIRIEVQPISGMSALEGGSLQILYQNRQIANHGISMSGG